MAHCADLRLQCGAFCAVILSAAEVSIRCLPQDFPPPSPRTVTIEKRAAHVPEPLASRQEVSFARISKSKSSIAVRRPRRRWWRRHALPADLWLYRHRRLLRFSVLRQAQGPRDCTHHAEPEPVSSHRFAVRRAPRYDSICTARLGIGQGAGSVCKSSHRRRSRNRHHRRESPTIASCSPIAARR